MNGSDDRPASRHAVIIRTRSQVEDDDVRQTLDRVVAHALMPDAARCAPLTAFYQQSIRSCSSLRPSPARIVAAEV